MKSIKHLFTALLLLSTTVATAHDFEVDGIYYRITNSEMVAVTYRGTSNDEYSNEYNGDVVIPETVTYSGTIYSVTSIEDYAFSGCSGLTSIEVPNSVTSIGDYAFNGCTSLKKLRIEDGTETLSLGDNYNFWPLPGKGLFYDCPLETLYLGRNLYYNTSNTSGYSPFYGKKTLTSVTICNSVTGIRDYAFYGCSGLTSIEIPNSVARVGGDAFEGTPWYNNLPDGVVYFGKTFYRYKGTMPENTYFAIKDGTLDIAGSAFSGCSGLTSIEIPNSVTSIGDYAFNGCTSLKRLRIEDGTETLSLGCNFYSANAMGKGLFYDCPLETLYLGRNLSYGSYYWGYSPFYGKKTLTSVTICNSVTSIEDYAFSGCSGLTSIEIPNSVTGIGDDAFNGCANVESLYIGSAIESIGDEAFAGCDKITDIKLGAEKPIRGNANIFTDMVYDNAILYVPTGTEPLYQKREPWNIFFYIVEMDFTGVEDVKAECGKLKGVYYDLSGRVVENPIKGVYIINGKKVLVK